MHHGNPASFSAHHSALDHENLGRRMTGLSQTVGGCAKRSPSIVSRYLTCMCPHRRLIIFSIVILQNFCCCLRLRHSEAKMASRLADRSSEAQLLLPHHTPKFAMTNLVDTMTKAQKCATLSTTTLVLPGSNWAHLHKRSVLPLCSG